MVLCTDLDNTIIYSYKHDIGSHTRPVELYQGRNISFITEKTYTLLQEVIKQMPIIPVSTRTVEQYKRIDLGLGELPLALVCNGGILLRNGEPDAAWYRKSRELAGSSESAMRRAIAYLEKDSRRTFEVRFPDELFVFTKCDSPECVVADLTRELAGEPVDVFQNGVKVYVVPKALSKGNAINRLRAELNDTVLAAGDSLFDVSMLETADFAMAPFGFRKQYHVPDTIMECSEDALFSEALLERCLDILKNNRFSIN